MDRHIPLREIPHLPDGTERLSDADNQKVIDAICEQLRERRPRKPVGHSDEPATTPELYPSIRGRAGVRFY